MAIGPANRIDPGVLGADRRAIRDHRIAVATAIVFGISSIFPTVAGFVRDTGSWPRWWGVLDVSIAFFLGILVVAILAVANDRINKPDEEATYRAYRVLIHSIFAGLVAFFLLGDRIIWSQCLTGFAWRAWLLCYCLPAWFTAFHGASAMLEANSRA